MYSVYSETCMYRGLVHPRLGQLREAALVRALEFGCAREGRARAGCRSTASLRTKILDRRGLDSSRILILRGGIILSIGNFPEIVSQRIFVRIILVGRLGVPCCDQRQGQPGAARGSQGQPGAARGSQGQPGAARGSQGQPGAVRGSQGQPGAARGSQGQPGAARGGGATHAERHP